MKRKYEYAFGGAVVIVFSGFFYTASLSMPRAEGASTLNTYTNPRGTLSKCHRNPWLRLYSDADFERDERQSYVGAKNMFSFIQKHLDIMATGPPIVTTSNSRWPGVPTVVEERDSRQFDVWPRSGSCPPGLARIGGEGDGGKLLCGVELLEDADECVVFSLGSAGKYEFEEGIYATTTGCITHTFDCTVSVQPPVSIRDRTIFHPICLGEPEGRSEYRTLQSLQAEFAPKGVSLLKMDIEGHEWGVFSSILQTEEDTGNVLHKSSYGLPHQISFELHWTHVGRREHTRAEVALLFKSLHDIGYRLISREDNNGSPDGCCSEFTVMRYFC
jgi:hypothetical protein